MKNHRKLGTKMSVLIRTFEQYQKRFLEYNSLDVVEGYVGDSCFATAESVFKLFGDFNQEIINEHDVSRDKVQKFSKFRGLILKIDITGINQSHAFNIIPTKHGVYFFQSVGGLIGAEWFKISDWLAFVDKMYSGEWMEIFGYRQIGRKEGVKRIDIQAIDINLDPRLPKLPKSKIIQQYIDEYEIVKGFEIATGKHNIIETMGYYY